MSAIKLAALVTAFFVAYMSLASVLAGQSGAPPAAQPAVISAASTWYPQAASAARASGDVVVEVEIDASGAVSSAHAVGGHPMLQKPSEEAASRWKFATDGKATGRKARLTFSYHQAQRPEEGVPPVFEPPYKVVVVNPMSRIL